MPRPRRVAALLALAGMIVLGVTAMSTSARPRLEGALRGALERGVRAADSYGGETQAAVWVERSSPMMAGRGPDVPRRMWSLSKPVTAIAAIQTSQARGGPTAELMGAIREALAASDNCAQRQVVLMLQESLGGRDATEAAFDDVLEAAGIDDATTPTTGAAPPECRSYLSAVSRGLSDPLAPAVQFGTVEWRLGDALRFANALGRGTYGSAGEMVLALMREPKKPAATLQPGDFTAPLDGPPSAGGFPAAWMPAYKGGWGGAALRPADFTASEIVVLDVAGRRVVIAVTFRPARQPSSDDPGRTVAPRAMSAVFDSVARALTQLAR